jgi:pimeloyl-ACP methyl ester carboxylesterase
MSSVQSWAGWLPALARSFRVVAMDLPGLGLTGVVSERDAAAFLSGAQKNFPFMEATWLSEIP